MIVVGLVMSACSSADQSVRVEGIDGLLGAPVEDAISIIPDASGTFATLEVTTTLPVVCSVAYGVDESFGLIATDDDMGGGAHQDHQARMDGLEPETTYSYVLQGADASGTLYRSEVMQFTTPATAVVDTPGPNVATEASVVDVSSEFSDDFSADNAIDGDMATEWSSAGDADDAFITIALGAEVDLVGVGFVTRSMGDGSATTASYTVTVDPDGRAVEFGPFDVGDGLSIGELRATGEVVRFDVERTTGGNTGAVEVEVYAAE